MSPNMYITRVLAALAAGALLCGSAVAGDFCADKETGNYANPDDCSSFIVCDFGGTLEIEMSCPAGLLWNDAGYCDWPFNVTCPEPEVAPEVSLDPDWTDERACAMTGGDLHLIHGYMADRSASIEACESACIESDFDCCHVDNDNFCYGAYTTGTTSVANHAAFVNNTTPFVDGESCAVPTTELHFIHGYRADREASLLECEAACIESDFDCCHVDNDNFCYGAFTTGTQTARLDHAAFLK